MEQQHPPHIYSAIIICKLDAFLKIHDFGSLSCRLCIHSLVIRSLTAWIAFTRERTQAIIFGKQKLLLEPKDQFQQLAKTISNNFTLYHIS